MPTFTYLTMKGEDEGKKLPLWKRTVIVDEQTGEIYAPAAACPVGEEAVFYCCGFDGVLVMRHRNHLFVPLSWLEREYPSWKELYDRMRANVEKFVVANN
jgi:hypothetical protein